jgi:hypothetical protein
MSMISHTERLADPVHSAVQSVDFKPEQLWTDCKGRHVTFADVTAQRGGNKLLDVTVPYF